MGELGELAGALQRRDEEALGLLRAVRKNERNGIGESEKRHGDVVHGKVH